jgi:hypothetical protein
MFHSIKKTLVTAVLLAALVPASASAMIGRHTRSGVAQSAPPTEVVVPTTQSSGFHWGDAGIGAAGALVLLIAAGGGVVVNARRRSHRAGLAAN